MIDLSTWLTKQEAADRIGVSTKAIERFTRAGKLEQRFRPQAGSPHVAVFFPDDVDRIAAERRQTPVPFVLDAIPDQPTNGNGRPHSDPIQALTVSTSDDPLRQLFAAAIRAVLSQTSQTSVSQTPTPFLTIAEASALTGLSRTFLTRMIKLGTLTAIRDRSYKVRRKDLEAL